MANLFQCVFKKTGHVGQIVKKVTALDALSYPHSLEHFKKAALVNMPAKAGKHIKLSVR